MSTEIRACRPGESDAVIALANRVFRPEGGDMGAQYPLMFAPENREGLRIAVEGGTPRALVGVCIRDAVLLGARLRVASIGAVCTEPQQRGRGLASAVMADARDYARRCGASLMLISGGRGLYHRLGYVTVGRFDRYELGPQQLHGLVTPIELSLYRGRDLPALAALHENEPVRFRRSAADWRALLETGMLMNRPSELLVVRQHGQPVAYLGVLRSGGGTRETPGTARVHELAGSRTALLAALPALRDQHQSASVSLVVQPTDVEMAVNARQHGWTATPLAFPGTLGVIDPPALMAALRPLLAERAEAAARLTVSATADEATFTLNGEQYQVGAPGPLAALLFGGDTGDARALPTCGGALGELLRALFPLPLLWQGYNYV